MSVRIPFLASCGLAALCLSACAPDTPAETEDVSDSRDLLVGVGVPVPAAGETEAVGTSNADAADDPEIWVDPADPSRGIILGTDKQAGLYVYSLDGQVMQFLEEGRLNNVDLRDGFSVGGEERVLIGASDRVRMGVALFLMDPATLAVEKWADIPVDLALPYGYCMGRRGEDVLLVLNSEDGDVVQLTVSAVDGQPVVNEERRLSVGSQTEGCVVDDIAGDLYIGEEARGIWRYSVNPANDVRVEFAAAPSEMLTPDVEGLTILPEGDARYLIASSQGDSAFAVWRIDGEAPMWQGRFSVMAAGGVDNVTGTDGLAAIGGPAGPFASGLIVVQDDVETEGGALTAEIERQNFKLVDWADVKSALGIE